ncbi:MAG: prolyl aminopeptidase [Betaproteobacteria bacterium]|nr:prolyl aminopeptidase [Betaproteobacteria bacterium]
MPDEPLKTALFLPVEAYETGRLAVDARHSLYFEQSGNPRGVPVVFLHGGPGSGASATHRQFFDPAFWRIVIFDQRGAGRSTPHGDTVDNTTLHLIADIEALRTHLGIERWAVFGGSWGSTLALAYAEHHPDRVLALCLRGIFLCRPAEIEWFLLGIQQVFPEHWRKFVSALPAGVDLADWRAILSAYHALLSDPDPAVHVPAARTWSTFEGSCSTLRPNPSLVANFASDRVALGLSRIEAHYFVNNIFLPENFLLANVGRIRHIPTLIVQGRYDMVCPLTSADDLARAFPEAEYRVVEDAGHSAFEPGICAALVEGMERMKAKVV